MSCLLVEDEVEIIEFNTEISADYEKLSGVSECLKRRV
jgi:hypothetical protein